MLLTKHAHTGCQISGNHRILDEELASAEELQASSIVLKHMYKEVRGAECLHCLTKLQGLATSHFLA